MKYQNLKDKDRPLLILDSGVGGLGILKSMIQKYPVENIIYICDNEMLPLGNKNVKILNRRIARMIKVIKKINPKGILIACNTIDSISGDVIRSSFPFINVYRIVESTMLQAVKTTKTKKIALLATKNTIESQSYMKYALAKKGLSIYGVECIELAKAIEDNIDVKQIFKQETSVLEGIEFDTLVLGCTHYSYIKNSLIKDKYPNIQIVDSSEELIKNYNLNKNSILENKANKQEINIYVTKITDEVFKTNVQKILNKDYLIEEFEI